MQHFAHPESPSPQPHSLNSNASWIKWNNVRTLKLIIHRIAGPSPNPVQFQKIIIHFLTNLAHNFWVKNGCSCFEDLAGFGYSPTMSKCTHSPGSRSSFLRANWHSAPYPVHWWQIGHIMHLSCLKTCVPLGHTKSEYVSSEDPTVSSSSVWISPWFSNLFESGTRKANKVNERTQTNNSKKFGKIGGFTISQKFRVFLSFAHTPNNSVKNVIFTILSSFRKGNFPFFPVWISHWEYPKCVEPPKFKANVFVLHVIADCQQVSTLLHNRRNNWTLMGVHFLIFEFLRLSSSSWKSPLYQHVEILFQNSNLKKLIPI